MAIVLKHPPLETYKKTSSFGPRYIGGAYGFHYGLDISARIGQNVFSVQDGFVKAVSNDVDGYGIYVVIEHSGYGFCSLYSHLLEASVSVGDYVFAGKIIGLADNTGNSFGSHLHIELIAAKYAAAFTRGYVDRVKNFNVDPEEYINSAFNSFLGVSKYKTIDKETYERQVDVLGEGNVGAVQFKRKYRIIVSDSSGNGINVSDLNVEFDCHKTVMLDNSYSIIKIYNLNAETESKMIQYATHVSIEAGYEGLYGLIFEGDVIQGIRYKQEATDFVLELVALDGDRLQSSDFNSLSIIRGQTKRQIVETIVSGFGATVQVPKSFAADGRRYPRGKSIFSSTKDMLQNAARDENALIYFDEGQLVLAKLSDLPSNEIVKLDYSSGLLGVPMQTSSQITFKALLNPRIKLNSLVHIDNTLIKEQMYSDGADVYKLDVDGVYRIIEIDFSGETRGNDWYISCSAVSQAGAIPSILANENTSLY